MLRATGAAFLAFILFLTLHVLDFHFLIPLNRTHSILWTAAIGIISFFILLRFLPPETWFQTKLRLNDKKMHRFVFPILGLLCYGFLFLGYLEFYFTAERSITFRMLMIIQNQPHHTITRKTMFTLYDVPGILDKRFDDLIYGGYLDQTGDEYQLTAKGNVILTIYQVAIEYLHLGSGQKTTASSQMNCYSSFNNVCLAQKVPM